MANQRRRSQPLRVLFALLLVLSLAAPAPVVPAPPPSYAPNTLHELGSVEQLRDLFNQEKGQVRLVLLLSPT